MRIVTGSASAVDFGGSAVGCAGQAVALFSRLDLTDLLVGIGTGPSRIRRVRADVLDLLDVPNWIVAKVFDVGAHGVAVVGVGQVELRPVVVGLRRGRVRNSARLAEMFAAASLN